MYSNKFVVAIKCGGKVLKEAKDLVHLPYGSEFSVLVKNLNSRRAKFTLHIDGQDVLDGENIIVNANSEVEMKRFIRNGNMNEGNAFKFVERTAAIEEGPQGIKVDDGLIRVEFWFEQEAPEIKTTIHNDVWWGDYCRPIYRTSVWSAPIGATAVTNNSIIGAATSASAAASAGSPTMDSYSMPVSTDATVVNDVGITVPGSKVEQKFHTVYGFKPEAQSHVIVIRMAGKVGEIEVAIPVIARTKQKCVTCNYTNKANSKFCSACGAALDLL